jgi:hypothetical protein
MRRLSITLLVLAGLLVGLDFLARSVAAGTMAGLVKTNLELKERPDVDLGGFPFMTQVMDGRLETVTLSLSDLSRRGVTLSSLSVRLDEVKFSLRDLLDQNARRLRVAAVSGGAELDEGDLGRALRKSEAPFEVRFDQGRMLASSPAVPREAEIQARVEGGRLVLSVPKFGETAIPLPRPIEGITYESVEILPGRLQLRFSSGPTTLRAPE